MSPSRSRASRRADRCTGNLRRQCHIRSVADGWARDGFLAVAPALFDRIQPGIELGYEGADMQTAMSLFPKFDVDKAILDVAAAVDFAAGATARKSASSAIASAAQSPGSPPRAVNRPQPSATTGPHRQLRRGKTHLPVMLHFGARTRTSRRRSREGPLRAPEVEVFWYDAGHAFNCEPRPSYNAAAAKEARLRSLEFFKKHLA